MPASLHPLRAHSTLPRVAYSCDGTAAHKSNRKSHSLQTGPPISGSGLGRQATAERRHSVHANTHTHPNARSLSLAGATVRLARLAASPRVPDAGHLSARLEVRALVCDCSNTPAQVSHTHQGAATCLDVHPGTLGPSSGLSGRPWWADDRAAVRPWRAGCTRSWVLVHVLVCARLYPILYYAARCYNARTPPWM